MSEAGEPQRADEPEAAPELTPQPPAQPRERARRPWPEVDPNALETKSFMTAHDVRGGLVAVTASQGAVLDIGAPSGFLSKLIKRVGDAIEGVGNLAMPPLVMSAEARASITVVFGDPISEDPQTAIPYFATWRASEVIALLMTLDDDEVLFNEALALGRGATGYAELVELVQGEGISLQWEPLGVPAQKLDVPRASKQHARLTAPAKMRSRGMTIEGLLYRAIYEDDGRGRVGIKLAQWSAATPRLHGRTAYLRYESTVVEDQILHNLMGKPVRATVRVEEPAPFTSAVATVPPYPVIEAIEEGHSFEPLTLGPEDFEEEFD